MEKQYVASISYGKDSLAMLHVITDVLHWPLDRIITADVWATDTIPADLPPMVGFKDKADKIIRERWGIEVEHFCAISKGKNNNYERQFYTIRNRRVGDQSIYGFPIIRGPWCNRTLKMNALDIAHKMTKGCVSYIGIAVDEPNRFHTLNDMTVSPLVEAEWTEQMCREWCEQNDLLSPIYTLSARGGCWFCHNQGVEQLRLLRRNYPDLWALLLKWDTDSPVTFHADGRTVHDFDERFRWEDEGYEPTQKRFRWSDLEAPQRNLFQYMDEEGNIDWKGEA